jgi:SAM-dependent methyltransferase
VRRAWNSFRESKIQDLLVFVCATSMPLAPAIPALLAEALRYEQIAACCSGTRILLAGANVSLCALWLAERAPVGTRIVALEGSRQGFCAAQEWGVERQLSNIRLIQDDLSAVALDNDASFDTVVALHLIEHLSGADLFCVLAELLRVTTRRLILAASPQDGGPARHDRPQQSAARVRLEAVGRWCLRKLGGAGHLWSAGASADLLIVERKG